MDYLDGYYIGRVARSTPRSGEIKKQLVWRCQWYVRSVTCPSALWGLSGEGLYTHTTMWDLWVSRRVRSATLETYGLGIPFNHWCNRHPYPRRAPVLFLTCCHPMLWVTRSQTALVRESNFRVKEHYVAEVAGNEWRCENWHENAWKRTDSRYNQVEVGILKSSDSSESSESSQFDLIYQVK
jgi:hypothetical protein